MFLKTIHTCYYLNQLVQSYPISEVDSEHLDGKLQLVLWSLLVRDFAAELWECSDNIPLSVQMLLQEHASHLQQNSLKWALVGLDIWAACSLSGNGIPSREAAAGSSEALQHRQTAFCGMEVAAWHESPAPQRMTSLCQISKRAMEPEAAVLDSLLSDPEATPAEECA